jgi:triphosphoribosyl-dephospho-CoA synthase
MLKCGMKHTSNPISIGTAATLACLYEVTARKPGNVYPGADFDETTTYEAFVRSAIAIGPIVERAPLVGVGITVLDTVEATRAAVGTNTNLGTLLLLAPLAAVPADAQLEEGIGKVLVGLTSNDTRAVYEAIRIAKAGGLGRVDVADVRSDPPPTLTLLEAMRLGADRDSIARQYTNNFQDVLGLAALMSASLAIGASLESAIIEAYLDQLARTPDTLIERKLGRFMAQEASHRAEGVLLCGSRPDKFEQELADFDRWLRADGNRRNPGTTADLVAAGLFVLIREGQLDWKQW